MCLKKGELLTTKQQSRHHSSRHCRCRYHRLPPRLVENASRLGGIRAGASRLCMQQGLYRDDAAVPNYAILHYMHRTLDIPGVGTLNVNF